MDVIFCGSEPVCFNPATVTSANLLQVQTSTGRTDIDATLVQRGLKLQATSVATLPALQDGAKGTLAEPVNYLWLAFNHAILNGQTSQTATSYAAADAHLLSFQVAGVRRIVFKPSEGNSSAGVASWDVYKVSASGTYTKLGTAAIHAPNTSTKSRVDVEIKYATNGYVRVYVAGTMVMDSGVTDVTTDGAVQLDAFVLGCVQNGASSVNSTVANSPGDLWSSVIAMTEDTRPMVLVSMRIQSASPTTQSFTSASVNNVTDTSDKTYNSSAAGGQVTSYFMTAYKQLTDGEFGSNIVRGVSTHVRAKKGSLGGPTKIAIGVETGTTNTVGGTITYEDPVALTTDFYNYSSYFDQNPNTGSDWDKTKFYMSPNVPSLAVKTLD